MDRYQLIFETWDKLALVYQEHFMDVHLYDDTYDRFCHLVEKPGARIFEIGCGPGNVTRYILSKRPDYKLEAIDSAPSMIELARANNPAANFTVMDCREIDKLTDTYDAILCGFCMPYLAKQDCAKLIKDTSSLLSQGGILYFSTIEGDYSRSGYETSSSGQYKLYVHYHQEDYLLKALKANGFELTDLIRKEYLKSDGTSEMHLIFISTKN
ncbi:methyltransferase type 11 [Pontibacter sp. HJ8]